MRFVVYGAGAVGGVLGGHLALDKHVVLLICREEHAQAIREQAGLRMKSATGDYFAQLSAAADTKAHDFDDETCVLFVPKSNDTKFCVEALARTAPPDTPLVSFQNGVGNEMIIAERFDDVYGGVCRMTCSFLHPGQVSYRKFGRLVVGKYPKGASPFAKRIAKLFTAAGFQTSASNDIMGDKWLKLVTNLQSAFNAVVDERDHSAGDFIRLKVGVLEEAQQVLAADDIRARSCDGRDPSVEEMIEDLKKPHAPRSPSAVRVHNSTWQNLYLKRAVVENAFFHGPIIERARKHRIAVPFNEVALESVTRCCEERTGTGQFRAADLIRAVDRRRSSH